MLALVPVLAAWALLILRFGRTWSLVVALALALTTVPLALVDARTLRLPRRWVHLAGAVVALSLLVAAAGSGRWSRLAVAAAWALGWLLVFGAIHLASPRLLGFGDVRLAPVLGAALGWMGVSTVIAGFFLANALAAVYGIGLLVTRRGDRRSELPYGTFLVLGAIVGMLVT